MLKKTFLYFAILISLFVTAANAQTAGFIYQGKLTDGSAAANGTYQFEFLLFDASVGGNQIGQTITNLPATVTNGIFAVELDFGASAFDGTQRFLEIHVRLNGSGQQYTRLNPRQAVTSTPYSVRSLNANQATVADNSLNLGGIPAAQYTQTTDPRLSDDRNPLPNSPNYIQNSTSQQLSSNFNISGEGKANIFSAATQFNIGASRVLIASAAVSNVFAGIGAGQSNPTGNNNSFFGANAGKLNLSGQYNSFFGSGAGQANTSGSNNAFFAANAGKSNTIGAGNSFFGIGAGAANSSGNSNAFFGAGAGVTNSTNGYNSFFGTEAGFNSKADANSFFGSAAGFMNTTGANNAFFGADAGRLNTIGDGNAFFGTFAGYNNTSGKENTFIGVGVGAANTTGSNNTLLGNNTNFGAGNLNFATAIGAGAVVSSSNAIVLGRAADTVQVPGNLTVANTFSANALDSATVYKIGGARILSNGGADNLFAGIDAGNANTGGFNAFFGAQAGKLNTSGFNNTFVGAYAGRDNTSGKNNAFFGASAGLSNTLGASNSFFGVNAGFSNLGGGDNSFFGNQAGFNNATGSFNAFFGTSSGKSVISAVNNSFFGAFTGETAIGGGNSFFGANAGRSTTNGFSNVFFGLNSGKENTTGSSNTFIGANSGQNQGATGSNNTVLGANAKVNLSVSNATAIGANAFADQSNTLVLGTSGVTTIVEGNLEVKGTTNFNAALDVTSINAGSTNTGNLNVNNGAFVITSNFNDGAVLNRSLTINGAISSTAQASFGSTTVSTLAVKTFGAGVIGNQPLCFSDNNPQVPLNPKTLAMCSSSRRYKENIEDYKSGIEVIKNLRPVTFDWKNNQRRDIGFIAEEVADVEPLLATRDSDGQIQGVKYAQITTALVNSVKEQQAQIEKLQQQVELLKTLLCANTPNAAVCTEKPLENAEIKPETKEQQK